jgi:hemoglobin
MKSTLFERYGGFGTVHKIVLDFYDRVLDSEVVGVYFDDIDMTALVDHQTKFISQVMGGPTSYSNEILEQVHASHRISQEAFDEMARLLEQTLLEHSFKPEDVHAVITDIRGRQSYIVRST